MAHCSSEKAAIGARGKLNEIQSEKNDSLGVTRDLLVIDLLSQL